MAFLDFIEPIEHIIDKILPDPNARLAAKEQLQQLAASEQAKAIDDQFQLLIEQAKTNQAEATNASVFVSGWRPFSGWICGSALAYQFLLQPLLAWISPLVSLGVPPSLDVQSLTTLLFGMLGLAGAHSFDKVKGVE